MAEPDDLAMRRTTMVDSQIAARGVSDERVLAAMRKVPRHRFMSAEMEAHAYVDSPQPIGDGQTISQPYIVAFMTAALDLDAGDTVLEIGTGCGYQTAVFAELVKTIHSVEIVSSLGARAADILKACGYTNIHLRIGDGAHGWPEAAPFDAIMVTCAPEDIPPSLLDQLAEGGRMIVPIGMEGQVQKLVLILKREGQLHQRSLLPVRFVPMTGDVGY